MVKKKTKENKKKPVKILYNCIHNESFKEERNKQNALISTKNKMYHVTKKKKHMHVITFSNFHIQFYRKKTFYKTLYH